VEERGFCEMRLDFGVEKIDKEWYWFFCNVLLHCMFWPSKRHLTNMCIMPWALPWATCMSYSQG